MIVTDFQQSRQRVLDLLDSPPQPIKGDLYPIVQQIMSKRDKILEIVKHHLTPFYLFDKPALKESIDEFVKTFSAHLTNFKVYYAMKCNNYPELVSTVASEGLGIDVSSGLELKRAIKCGAKNIIFTGPGKTLDELKLAIKYHDAVIINIDSFRELEKLGELTNEQGCNVIAGVRIYTKYHKRWTKFGIPVEELAAFFTKAERYPHIKLSGIQVHMSWNESVVPYENALKEIAAQLPTLTPKQKQSVSYLDIGGGYLPHQTDSYYPWKHPAGNILQMANAYYGIETEFEDKYYIAEGLELEEYAKGVAKAVETHIRPLTDCMIFLEPGRVIANKALHFVVSVLDVKDQDMAITDGGIHMAGWERYLNNYFPIINLTHPSDTEIPFNLFGSLCTPDDVWGKYCYAEEIEEGDIVVIPNQGAYTYSYAQNFFIKPQPPIYTLE